MTQDILKKAIALTLSLPHSLKFSHAQILTRLRAHALTFPLSLLLLSCSPQIETHFCTSEDILLIPQSTEQARLSRYQRRQSCNDVLAYIPDTTQLSHRPMRYVRVNVHFMNSADSSQNYWGDEAITFAEKMIGNVNIDLTNNAKMNLPLGNDTPVLPTQYRLRLTGQPDTPDDKGIYCHFDDELYYHVHKGKNRNISKRDAINKYSIQKDSVVNIFLMPHHPDSVISKSYAGGVVGVALGTAIKLGGDFKSRRPYWHYRQTLNHEVGHVFGLQHTWAYNDGCSDTPKNPNCWNKGSGVCDSLLSNNLMDYNAWQLALTPCQIGRVHRMMSKEGRKRNMLIPTWCTLDSSKTVYIRDTVVWRGAYDLEGHIKIERGGSLEIQCRAALPPDAHIKIAAGGELILNNGQLHNACEQTWEGILIESKGEEKGILKLQGDYTIEDMRMPIAGLAVTEETTEKSSNNTIRQLKKN
ncbi:MAG: M43 family zinc metalloprotease [Bacteroidota bacterium]